MQSLLRDLGVLAAGSPRDALANADLERDLRALAPTFRLRARHGRVTPRSTGPRQALDRNASPKIVADWVAAAPLMTARRARAVGRSPSAIRPASAPRSRSRPSRDPRVIAVCQPVLYGPHDGRGPRGVSRRAVSTPVRAARPTTRSSRPTADALAGRVDAIVTAPINKAAFAAAGLPWRGHTDLLAHLCGVADVAMMFWSERLRVVLATVHIPLARRAARADRASGCSTIIRLTAASLPRFGIAAPRLAVAGLNPHAGEARPARARRDRRDAPGGRDARARGHRRRRPVSGRHAVRARRRAASSTS